MGLQPFTALLQSSLNYRRHNLSPWSTQCGSQLESWLRKCRASWADNSHQNTRLARLNRKHSRYPRSQNQHRWSGAAWIRSSRRQWVQDHGRVPRPIKSYRTGHYLRSNWYLLSWRTLLMYTGFVQFLLEVPQFTHRSGTSTPICSTSTRGLSQWNRDFVPSW